MRKPLGVLLFLLLSVPASAGMFGGDDDDGFSNRQGSEERRTPSRWWAKKEEPDPSPVVKRRQKKAPPPSQPAAQSAAPRAAGTAKPAQKKAPAAPKPEPARKSEPAAAPPEPESRSTAAAPEPAPPEPQTVPIAVPEPFPTETETTPPAAPKKKRAAKPKAKGSALERDLSYYRRAAEARSMTPNDRLYLLYQLQNKHAGTGANMKSLKAEITRWETAKSTGEDPGPPEPEPVPEPPAPRPSRREKAPPPPETGEPQGVILVTGLVARPQTMIFRPGIKMPEVLTAVGGLQENADQTVVQVRRGRGEKQEVFLVDPRPIVPALLFQLQPGDVVEAVKNIPPFTITGSVLNPGRYPWEEDVTVLDLLNAAGGPAPGAKTNRITVVREEDDGQVTLRVDLIRFLKGYQDENPVLKEGDVVMVP